MNAEMHARQRPSGTWTVDGGGKPGYFPGGEDPMFEDDNEGGALDCFGADDPDYVGFEYMDLAKAGTGLLQGFGGMFSGGGGGGGAGGQGQMTPAQAAEKQRLEDEKRRAEQSATNMKIALGVTGGVGLLGLFAFLLRR